MFGYICKIVRMIKSGNSEFWLEVHRLFPCHVFSHSTYSYMDHPHCQRGHTPSYIKIFIHTSVKWSGCHVWRTDTWIGFLRGSLPGHCGQGQCGMWELVVVVIWLMLWNAWSCQWESCESSGRSSYWVWPRFEWLSKFHYNIRSTISPAALAETGPTWTW